MTDWCNSDDTLLGPAPRSALAGSRHHVREHGHSIRPFRMTIESPAIARAMTGD